MKKIKNKIIVAIIVMVLFGTVQIASAESDASGDVYHQTVTGTKFNYELFGDRDHIDITDISHSVSGSNVTISLTVKDSIDTESQNIFYYAHIKAKGESSTDWYQFYYTQGQGFVIGNGEFTGYYDIQPDFTISGDGKTISYTFTDIDTSYEYEPWAYAAEYFDFTQQEGGEAWLDYAPGSYAPWYGMDDDPGGDDNGGGDTGNGDDSGGSTTDNDSPGFGIIALIGGLALLIFVFRKRK